MRNIHKASVQQGPEPSSLPAKEQRLAQLSTSKPSLGCPPVHLSAKPAPTSGWGQRHITRGAALNQAQDRKSVV